jgi:hypothetical protein
MQTEIRPSTTDEQRICSNPDCIHEGKPQLLDATHFAPNQNYAGGYKTRCRDCERQTRRDRYKRKRDEELAYNKGWVEEHRDERNTYQRDRNREIMEVYRSATKERSA